MRKFLRWSIIVLVSLFVLVVALIGPVDFAPLKERPFYQRTMLQLDTFKPAIHSPKTKLKAGWSAINITPKSRMPMAGYAPRNHFNSVHDSVYVRILVIDNGSIPCIFVSADLLLFPPALKDKIVQRIGPNRFLYFSATHAHSSLGAWDDSTIGNLILGSYNEPWLDSLTSKIISRIDLALAQLQPASLNYFEADANEYVENRLAPEHGQTDGKIRGLKITRADGSKGLLASYSAHPTNISHLSLALSGDYPAALVRKAEQKEFRFAMFTAGMVGSHRVKGIPETEFAQCDTLADKLLKKIRTAKNFAVNDSVEISTATILVEYGPSQLHVLQKYKVRDWVFRGLFSPLKGEITYLRIGNIILLGMPCDFSGEIFVRDGLGTIAESHDQKLFITSFNGQYVGYITYDEYYGHSEQEEVMAMNWVGPYYGDYFSQITKKILSKSK